METPNLHVAILASPGMGHIMPCLELAKTLVSQHNVEVTLFVPTTHESTTQTKKNLQSLTRPQHLHLITLPPIDISNTVLDLASSITYIVKKSIPAVRSAIPVLIVDVFGTQGFDVADELGMGKYHFFTSNATVLAYMTYLPNLLGQTGGNLSNLGELIRVPGCEPVRVEDIGGYMLDQDSDAVKCMLGHTRRYAQASGILVNTFDDLEKGTVQSLRDEIIRRQIPIPPVYPVGPLSRKPTGNNKSDCLTWLDSQPLDSVLFVSFGSGGSLSAEQTIELAEGLELSQKRFLWAIRQPQDIANAAYLSNGNAPNDPSIYLPDGFLTRTKDVGLVVPDWVPQVEVLNHPSIGAFLSHCGWNSTLESILHGVPLITWPLHAEQHWNALLLAQELGVAIRLRFGSENGVIKLDEIEKTIRLMMEGEEGKVMKNAAKKLKCNATRAVEKGGQSYNSLSELVKKWKTKFFSC